RRLCRQIYSLLPLAARAPTPVTQKVARGLRRDAEQGGQVQEGGERYRRRRRDPQERPAVALREHLRVRRRGAECSGNVVTTHISGHISGGVARLRTDTVDEDDRVVGNEGRAICGTRPQHGDMSDGDDTLAAVDGSGAPEGVARFHLGRRPVGDDGAAEAL